MKKNGLIIILLLGFFISSCEKEDKLELNYKIIGEWTWMRSYGGFTGNDMYTPENTGINKTAIFLNNDTVILIENSDTIGKVEYYLSREESILLKEKFNFLTLNYKYRITNPDSIIILPMRYIIRTLNDTLVIDEDVYDGFGHEYLRNNNR